MKLRLVDQTIHAITRAEIINGRLEIDFADKTAEEVEAICSVPANFAEIELLTDSDEVFSDGIRGWTVYGGAWFCYEPVNPTCVGMDRRFFPHGDSGGSKPHVRGDGPNWASSSSRLSW